MRKQIITLLALSGFFCATSDIQAAEFYDQAKVIRYEPIIHTDHRKRVVPGCVTRKPNTIDLIELLQWDLATNNCLQIVTDETITGYKVFYEWDSQLFSQVTHEPPGKTIPVHIMIN